MSGQRRFWRFSKYLGLALALGATYGASALVAMRVAIRAKDVKVPSVVGRDANQASTVLADAGLLLKVEGRRNDDKVPAEHILEQEPAAGAMVKKNRSIKVWVSLGERVAAVPALQGESERTAELRLQQDGFSVGDIAEIRSADYSADAVVAQEPPPEGHGKSVSLLINRPEEGPAYLMPDLIGTDGGRAAAGLRARGFRVAIVGEQPYPGLPAGVVIRQVPQAGYKIRAGDSISIEISR